MVTNWIKLWNIHITSNFKFPYQRQPHTVLSQSTRQSLSKKAPIYKWTMIFIAIKGIWSALMFKFICRAYYRLSFRNRRLGKHLYSKLKKNYLVEKYLSVNCIWHLDIRFLCVALFILQMKLLIAICTCLIIIHIKIYKTFANSLKNINLYKFINLPKMKKEKISKPVP